MGKNLAGKTASIIAVLVIFFYGIFFGFNAPRLGSLKTLISNNINLGLDLKGGTHLVLEVHVAEAIASAVDRDAARLEADLQKAGITGATVGRTDPAHPQTIVVSGIPAARLGDVHSLVQGTDYASYEVTTAPDGGLMLTMKQAAARDLASRTLDTSIETIRERIDKLGVSEPVIQRYGLGDNQILVELPGVSDPARVEEVIQSTAKLEIHAVVGGPWATDQDALQANNGVIPPDSMLVKGSGSAGGSGAGLVAETSE